MMTLLLQETLYEAIQEGLQNDGVMEGVEIWISSYKCLIMKWIV